MNQPMKLTSAIPTDEALALVRYAARQGVEPATVEGLSAELQKESPDWAAVDKLYTDLVAKTTPVNGRSVLDSQGRSLKRLLGITSLTAIFFLVAVGNELADHWLADLVPPDEGTLATLIAIKRYVWDYLTPFFWGGLGSCIYLIKKIQDKTADFQYEHARFQGWIPRILLGGILGATVQFVFDPESFGPGIGNLSANTLAFLTGISVKVVYGAIEKLVAKLSEKLGLQQLREGKPKSDDKEE